MRRLPLHRDLLCPEMLNLVYVVATCSSLDRTGRRSAGHPTQSIGAAVKNIEVLVGGEHGKEWTAQYEKYMQVGGHRTKGTWRFHRPEADGDSILDSYTFSGSVLDVSYEASRRVGEAGTDVQLAYALPTGLLIDANVRASDAAVAPTLESMSAFHLAGPFNLQSSWLCAARTLQLKIGRGNKFGQCPISLQTDISPGTSPNFEVGMRQELGQGLRKLTGRLLLPARTEDRSLWCEYEDSTISNGGVWIAKATMPLADSSTQTDGHLGVCGGALNRIKLSLRMALQW